jgi:hypothetical protein
MSWWELKAIADTHKAWKAAYYALPPDACPNDGTPLEMGYQTQTGGGRLLLRHCPMGDFVYTGGRRQT